MGMYGKGDIRYFILSFKNGSIQKHREKGEDGCRRILGEILDFCFPLPLPQPLDQRPHDPKALICQPVSGSITVTGRGRREKQKEQNTE